MIKKLKKLVKEFDPYNDDFCHDDWLGKVAEVLGEDKENFELCDDYFYDGQVLWGIIRGMEHTRNATIEECIGICKKQLTVGIENDTAQAWNMGLELAISKLEKMKK